jgi:hypothetical protein
MRHSLTLAITLSCLIGLTGCADFAGMVSSDRFHEDFHYTFPVGQNARIDAESFNGPIGIEGWDRDDVEITGSKYAGTESARDAIKIDVHHTADSVEIRAIKPSDFSGNAGAKFTLHVPRSAWVNRVITSNGAIQVEDVGRAEHLKTSNGAIKISGVHGEVDAHTSNASIDVTSLDGMATLKTSNGRIHADNLTGGLEAETSNGGIVATLASAPPTPVKLSTSNSSIELTMDKPPLSDIRAETRNSSITVHLPAGTGAKISADTSNSSVACDFDLNGENEKGHLSGTIGSGGHSIELTTSNGHIHIAKGGAAE